MQGLELFVSMAAGAGLLGGGLAAFWVPALRTRSAIQHFAAGVVIAAVAMKLMPDVLEMGRPAGILAGFAVGGLVMIALKWLVRRFERRRAPQQTYPMGLTVAAAIDTLIDGAIIGAGFSARRDLGVLLAASLGLELFFLTLSVGSEWHRDRKRIWTGMLVTIGIALLLPIGALSQRLVLHDASQPVIAMVLSFGAAALIYLVAEELLVESFEAEENLFSTAMLYGGFLAILVFELLERS